MTPGERVGVDAAGHFQVEKEVKLDDVTAWQRGNLVIDDAVLVLERYFGLKEKVRSGDEIVLER